MELRMARQDGSTVFAGILAIIVGSGLAHLGTSTMPFQIGALIEGKGGSPSEVGLFGFLEVGALAISMILLATVVSRIPPRLIAMAGCLLILSGNAGLFLLSGRILPLILAVIAGMGYGCVFAATITTAAAGKNPDRLYAIGNTGALVIIAGLMSSLPSAASHFGPLGVFAALAALSFAGLLAFPGFRRQTVPEAVSDVPKIAAFRLKGGSGLLFAWTTYSIGTGGLYAFSERIGNDLGLEKQSIAAVLTAGTFVGLAGTGAAAILSGWLDRRIALVVGMFGTGLACLSLGYSSGLVSFAVGVCAYWIFSMFLYCCLLGTAAVLDRSGQLGTLCGGLERLGYGLGVWLAGVTAEHFSYASTGALGCCFCVVGLVFGYPSVFRVLGGAGRK